MAELGYSSFDLAASEKLAIAAAEARCPDLITADDRLIDGTGVNALLVICAQQPMPVVFIAAVLEDIIEKMPSAIVISKPFKEADLTEAVGRAIVAARNLPPGVPPWAADQATGGVTASASPQT